MNASDEDCENQHHLELLRQGKLEKQSLTQEQWHTILLEIIRDGQASSLEEFLLKFDVYDSMYEKKLANSDQSTMFGQTCLKFYNKDVVRILHKAGINHIGETEMRQLLATALSPSNCECTNKVLGDPRTAGSTSNRITEGTSDIETECADLQPTASGSSVRSNEENDLKPMLTQHKDANTDRSSACGRHLAKQITNHEKDSKVKGMIAESTKGCTETCSPCVQTKLQAMDNLRDILTECKFSPLLLKLLDLSDCEYLKALSHKGTTGWLYNFLRYGEIDTESETRPALALTQMERCDWDAAMETISSCSDNKDLLDKHIYISFPSQDAGSDWTLLSYAVYSQRANVVQLILELGADPNTFCGRNVNGTLSYFTPFELSVEIGNSEICSLLVQHEANIYLQSTGAAGKIVKNAIRNGDVEVLKIILAHRNFAFDILINYIDKLPVLQSDVIKRQALQDVLRFDGISVRNDIFRALENKDFEAAACYINESDGATLSEEVIVLHPPHEGQWLLVVFAARQDSFETIQLLRDKGVSINTFCSTGDRILHESGLPFISPLFEAILNDNVDLCSKLMQHGAQTELDVEGFGRYHAWTAAFHRRTLEIYYLLLQYTPICGFVHVFLIYMDTCKNANPECDVLSVYNVHEVFPLDALKLIFHYCPISESTWLYMFLEVSYSRPGSVMVRKAKRMLLQLLFNFQPSISADLRIGWRRFDERIGRLPPDIDDSAVEDWFKDYMLKCPSLQSLCRSVIRYTCVSCDPEAFRSLELPCTLEEYIQLPPGVDDPDLPLEI